MTEPMNVAILGGGGREHALFDKLNRSPLVDNLLCMPGNGGISQERCRPVDINAFSAVKEICERDAIGLLVVGPEQPLVDGIADYFRECAPYIKVFGPSKSAAELEGSKIFTKTRCRRWGIKTADFDFAGNHEVAEQIIKRSGYRVIKADGLCAGKGVVVAESEEEALEAVHQFLVKRIHRNAGAKIVMEDRLVGRECSVMAFCDGINAVLMPPARDYKRAYDGDKGPNTGGMGAYSPLPDVNDELLATIKRDIVDKLMAGMRSEGRPYQGVMYAGLMITPDNVPYLIEVNCRFGDPETEVVLPALETDLCKVMLACTEEGGLAGLPPLKWDGLPRVDVVMTSSAYPASSDTKSLVRGLSGASGTGVYIYHAGTKRLPDGTVQMNGGRILNIVGLGQTIATARDHAYRAVGRIHFPGRYRNDIAAGV